MSSESGVFFVQCSGCGEERSFKAPEERNLFAVKHSYHGGVVYRDPKARN